MTVYITKTESEEIQHKLNVLLDTPDLQESYGLSEEETKALVRSIPVNGGVWRIPENFEDVVKGEMADHVIVLLDQARSARKDNRFSEWKTTTHLARRLEKIFTAEAVE
jgi:hypothetical protein